MDDVGWLIARDNKFCGLGRWAHSFHHGFGMAFFNVISSPSEKWAIFMRDWRHEKSSEIGGLSMIIGGLSTLH